MSQPDRTASNQSAQQSPRDLILSACRALFAPDQVVELRILGINRSAGRPKGNAAGWFNDLEALANEAARWDARSPGEPEGVYTTLNLMHEGCLARSPNKVTEWQKVTTSDRDIIRRHWFPIDVDSIHPVGVSASDGELQDAKDLAAEVRAFLEGELSFPAGMVAMSGNGIHLNYRIDIATPDEDTRKEATDLIKACLAALGSRFTGPRGNVDQTCINPARIFKLYGTTARKGNAIADRPHRRSHLLWDEGTAPKVFSQWPAVTMDKLHALAAMAPGKGSAARGRNRSAATTTPAGPSPGFLGSDYAVDLDAYIAAHQLPVVREESFDGTGKRYILSACLFDSSHTGTSAALGRSKDGAVFYKCMHDSCSGKTWQDVKAKLGPVTLTPEGQAAAAENKKASKARSRPTPSSTARSDADDDSDPYWLAKQFLDEECTDPDLGEIVVRRHKECYFKYEFNRRCYRPLADDDMRVLVRRWLGSLESLKVTNKKLGDVVGAVDALISLPSDVEAPAMTRVSEDTKSVTCLAGKRRLVACRNGLVDLDKVIAGYDLSECMERHTTEWFSTIALPFDFPIEERQAQCGLWEDFLWQIFQGDQTRIDLLQEAFGSCFLERSNLEAFWVFHGAGRNGKSTVINVLRALLDEENTSSLDMVQMSSQTMRYGLAGKLANLCADMNEMSRVEEGLLKAIVSGDLITADVKYKPSIQFRPTCKLFFATNTLPRFVDNSIGIWRRMQLIPFDFIVDEDAKDPDLLSKLEKELPGIFWWALQGAKRLRETGKLTTSERCASALRDYRLSCLPVLMFLEECVDRVKGQSVVAGELWNAYRKWCDACGLKKPKPLHVLINEILNFWPGLETTTSRSEFMHRRVIYGVKMRGCLPFEDQVVPADLPRYWDK